MNIIYYTLCDYETWYHAREVFTVLALGYLVLRDSCPNEETTRE